MPYIFRKSPLYAIHETLMTYARRVKDMLLYYFK